MSFIVKDANKSPPLPPKKDPNHQTLKAPHRATPTPPRLPSPASAPLRPFLLPPLQRVKEPSVLSSSRLHNSRTHQAHLSLLEATTMRFGYGQSLKIIPGQLRSGSHSVGSLLASPLQYPFAMEESMFLEPGLRIIIREKRRDRKRI